MTADPFFVQRTEDLLILRVEVVNLARDGALLVREDPDAEALLMFGLPPQHIDETFVRPGDNPGFQQNVPAFEAPESRLVFALPEGQDSIELSSEAILDWNSLRPMAVPGLPPDDPAVPDVFGGLPRTAIEFPTRLLLGHEGGVFWASTLRRAVTAGGRSELCHADLRGEDGGPALLRAFFTPVDRPPHTDLPLDDQNRSDLVILTHHNELIAPDGLPDDFFRREPLRAERFVITPLGASVRMGGHWEPNSTTSLSAYQHIAELGRDTFVQVTERGYLSTGHRAQLVTTTERLFEDPGDSTSVAVLRQRVRITVLEPEMVYDEGSGYPHEGREMPFRSLRVVDATTPPIDTLSPDPDPGIFWVKAEGASEPYPFTLVGADHEGRTVAFTLPLLFIDARRAGTPELAEFYNADRFLDRRTALLGGQTAALAHDSAGALRAAGAPGATAMPVSSLVLTLPPVSGHPLAALPALASARVRVPAVEQLTGLATDSEVVLHQAYLDSGIEGQATGAFLALTEDVPVAFGGGKGGGIARPDAAVRAITAKAGLLPAAFAEADAAVQGLGTAQLEQIFGQAKLLGVVPLSSLLDDVAGGAIQELAALDDEEIRRRLQGLSEELLPVPIMRARELAEGREIRYLWKPRLKRTRVPLDPAGFAGLDLTRAFLTMEATTVCSPKALQESVVRGELKGFALDFSGIVRVDFGRLSFTARPGSRPDLGAEGLRVELGSVLEFVNTLKDLLPTDGFGKGSFVDVTPQGISAGYSLAVPAVQVGIFALSNITLTAALTVPFDDRPVSFRFSVSERHKPFNLSVALFGGGGFFSLVVSTRGVELIEGSLEFGGNASLDLGVASGGVHLMGGVYFAFAQDSVTLTGYLRCGGYLSVLGLVSVSVEFNLQLSYVKTGNTSEVVGEGSVCVSVRVAFFSKSVRLSLQRRFGGSPADPRFVDCVEPDDWDRYCAAFAP